MSDPLEPFLRAMREQMQTLAPGEISAMDQFRSASGERARELLAYHVLTCMHKEEGKHDEATRYALKFALKVKALSQWDFTGVVLTLAELLSEFMLAQGDGTFKNVVDRLLDPDIPLIPGRNEALRELDKQFDAEGPSGG